jgi:hypothetical protein
MKEIALFPVTLRTMTDRDLWWFFLQNRELCSSEFWQEVDNRKAVGILSEASPFWNTSVYTGRRTTWRSIAKSNIIELTPEEWEARKRRTMFRMIPA